MYYLGGKKQLVRFDTPDPEIVAYVSRRISLSMRCCRRRRRRQCALTHSEQTHTHIHTVPTRPSGPCRISISTTRTRARWSSTCASRASRVRAWL